MNNLLVHFKQNSLAFSETVQKEFLSEISNLKNEINNTSSFEDLSIKIESFEERITNTTNELQSNFNKNLQEEYVNLSELIKNQDTKTSFMNKLKAIQEKQESQLFEIKKSQNSIKESVCLELNNISERIETIELDDRLEKEVKANQELLKILKLTSITTITLLIMFACILIYK